MPENEFEYLVCEVTASTILLQQLAVQFTNSMVL